MKWEIRETAAGHCDIYPEGQRASDGKVARVPYKTNTTLRDKHARLVAAAPELLDKAIECANILADYEGQDGQEGELYASLVDLITQVKG